MPEFLVPQHLYDEDAVIQILTQNNDVEYLYRGQETRHIRTWPPEDRNGYHNTFANGWLEISSGGVVFGVVPLVFGSCRSLILRS